MVHIQQFSQIFDETISFQGRGSTWMHFWRSQPIRIPMDDTNTTKPLPSSAQTQHLMDMTKLLYGPYPTQFSQLLDETISYQGKGSTWMHFWCSQPLRIPIYDINTTKPLPSSAQTQHLMEMTKLLNAT
jgi:hypothetical protein